MYSRAKCIYHESGCIGAGYDPQLYRPLAVILPGLRLVVEFDHSHGTVNGDQKREDSVTEGEMDPRLRKRLGDRDVVTRP